MPRDGWSARLDDPPGVVVVAHVATPGQRLVRDPDAVLGGVLGKRAELGGGKAVVVDRGLGHVRADEHEVRAETLHDREFVLRSSEVVVQLALGHGLEVTERLVEPDPQTEVGRAFADLLGGQGGGDEIGLEQLHLVEAGVRRRLELFLERAAQADRRDRPAHSVYAAWRASAVS